MKKVIKYWTVCVFITALTFSGCNRGTAADGLQPEPAASAHSAASVSASESAADVEIEIHPAVAEPEQDAEQGYIDRLV